MSTQDHPPGDQADGAQDLQEAVDTVADANGLSSKVHRDRKR